MTEWFKRNWFKVALLAGLFGLVVVINQQSIDKSGTLRLAKQCKDDSAEYFQKDKDTASAKRLNPGLVDCYYFEPAYIFNKELNTCLYSGGYSCDLEHQIIEGIFKGEPAKIWERHIVDIYSNKVVADASVGDTSTIEEWEKVLIESFWEDYKEFGF